MKTPTPPAVSEELDIPKPAPGENVYPIYSQGVICGYIHSGGNQKTHKIFLNGENQTSSTENKCTKPKTNDSEKKSCSAKFSQKIAAKRTSTQSVSSKHKKAKTVSSTGKKSVLPNASSIESNILIGNPSDKLNIPCSPTKRPNGDNVDLGNKGCMSNDSISMPVFETPSELATSTAHQNVQQIKTPTDCSLIDKQNSNAKSSVVMTSSSLCSLSSSSVTSLANKIVTSSNVTPSTKDTVVLSPPLMNNFNQPIVLASNNLALQSTNWVQPSWPNPVAYVIVPATNDLSQAPVYLANSTNNLSPVLPTVTNVSLATTTTTTTAVSTVDSPVQPPSITISTANTPITKTSQVTTTSNSCNQLLTMLPLKGVVPKSTFVQLPLQLSSSINKKQPTDSPLKDLKVLEQSNLEDENDAFETTSAVNESSENIAIQQSSKPEADNSVPALQSLNCTVSNDEKMSKESLSFGHNTQSNEGDTSSTELNKTVEEKTLDSNLSVNSDQKDKLETSSDAMVFISEENKSLPYQSFSENIKFTLVPVKKKRRGRPRKPLVPPPKYERKHIPILPATANMEVRPVNKQHTFNLLPSGNYVICFQKETNDSSLSGGQSDELNVNLSQHETNQQVICDKVKKRRGRKSKSKPSLCEGKEMPNLPTQIEMNVKTEPFDEDSELNQEECESQSNNCASSASPLVANTRIELPTKEEEDSETNSTIQEGENELVISNCFSLSSPTESHRKFIPFNITNLGLENLFHLPNQIDLCPESLDAASVVQDENSTKAAEEVKLKKCSVKLEQLDFPSDSLAEPSSSPSEENNLPCTKPAENSNTFCNSTLKEDESNVAKVGSSANVSTLPTTGTKISLKTPAKSILDPEYLKKLKNYLSVEKTEFPVLSSDSNEVSLESKSKSSFLSKDFLSGSINDSLKAFDKSFADLPFNVDSIVANLPKDDEADAFIEGCIAFHQQQLYLLQLQMDQHKSTLEKLKKAQVYLKSRK